MNDFMRAADFVAIEGALLEEFKTFIMPHLPAGCTILKKAWDDLFLYYKMAQSTGLPEFALKGQLQKLIAGWWQEGSVRTPEFHETTEEAGQ